MVFSLCDFDDKKHVQDFCEAKGLNLEFSEEDDEYEEIETNSMLSVKDLISNLELTIKKDIEDIRFCAISCLNGKKIMIDCIEKDVYHTFGMPNDCYIIKLK